MCVAVPGEVIKVHNSTARVRIRQVILDAECALMESVVPGDRVLVHAGFIIEKISPEESDRMMKDMENYSNITSQWEKEL
jgi:hydrogenase expression/formation protein HypC